MSEKDIALKALAHLEGNQDFEKVLEYIAKLHADSVTTCAVATDLLMIGREQGKQHVLGDFLKMARSAREILARRG